MSDLFVLVGASASGKTTLVRAVTGEDQKYGTFRVPNLTRIITCTSREPREGEREGIDYYFIGLPGFARESDFIEQATYVDGTRYGLWEKEAYRGLEKGPGIIIMEVQGAQQLIDWNQRVRGAETTLVHMAEVPRGVLEARIRASGDVPARIEKRVARLASLEKEYAGIRALVAKQPRSYCIQNEGNVEAGIQQLKSIIESHRA